MMYGKMIGIGVLFLMILSSTLALDLTVDQRYSETSVVPINGTCLGANVPVAFQVTKGANTEWVTQSVADGEKRFAIVFTPSAVGNYTIYAACSSENKQKDFCIGAAEQCSLTRAASGVLEGTTTCISAEQCRRSWGRINAGEMDTFDTQGRLEITSVTFTALSTMTSTPSMEITQLSDLPQNVDPFQRTIYKMYEIRTNPLFDTANNTITFRLPKSWLAEKNQAPADVKLFRFVKDWVELSTTVSKQDATYQFYEATTPAFSYFIIGGKKVAAPSTPAAPVTPLRPPESARPVTPPVAAPVAPSAASCNDGIRNQGEEQTDCGGPCAPCATCTDGIQNQGEQGLDCGGPCPLCVEEVPWYQDIKIIGSVAVIVVLLIALGVVMLIRKKKVKSELRHISELREYIQEQLSAGHTEQEVKSAVRRAGWSEDEIRKAF